MHDTNSSAHEGISGAAFVTLFITFEVIIISIAAMCGYYVYAHLGCGSLIALACTLFVYFVELWIFTLLVTGYARLEKPAPENPNLRGPE